MSQQTWKVVATPRERWNLSTMLLHRDLKFKTRESERRLSRARRALGLLAPTEAFLASPKQAAKYAKDRTTRHQFTVTAENAEFVIAQLETLEKNSVDALVLEPLLEQLEAKADTAGADEAPVYDEAAELAHWKPSVLPVLDEPEKFLDVFMAALAEAGRTEPAMDHLHNVLVKALAPPPEPTQPNGHVAAAPA